MKLLTLHTHGCLRTSSRAALNSNTLTHLMLRSWQTLQALDDEAVFSRHVQHSCELLFCIAFIWDLYSAFNTTDFSVNLNVSEGPVIVIVIIISKLLKCHSKAKCSTPGCPQALYQIIGFVQRIVRGRLSSSLRIRK